MKKTFILITLSAVVCSCGKEKQEEKFRPEDVSLFKEMAFKSHSDSVPANFDKLFELSHDYPSSLPKTKCDFIRNFKGPVNVQNVGNYVLELKKYVAPTLDRYISQKENYNAKTEGWFHEPWMGDDRDAIMGTYPGNSNVKGTFKGINVHQYGFVHVMYDSLAAYTIGQVFDENGMAPIKIDKVYFEDKKVALKDHFSVALNKSKGQFEEGAVIVKFAFSHLNGDEWDAMQGAPKFKLYNNLEEANPDLKGQKYKTREVSLFQIDVVIKDSKNAPETGWVFTTFVYDKSIKSDYVLDKFVPLGAVWGNDPSVESTYDEIYTTQNKALKETWVNEGAPYYSRETLGYGGRLSGPNDGAVAIQDSYMSKEGKKVSKERIPMSSCISCHLPAQQQFKSPLVPFSNKDTAFLYYGSEEFKRHYRNLNKGETFDKGQFSFDYNMALSFKAFNAYIAFSDTYYRSHVTKGKLKMKQSMKQKSNMQNAEEDYRVTKFLRKGD